MAKQCCVCKRKIGLFGTGHEIASRVSSYVLCDDCNVKKLNLRSASSKEEFHTMLHHFSPLLDNPATPTAVLESFANLEERVIGSTESTIKEKVASLKFGGNVPLYTFTIAPFATFMMAMKFETKAYVFADRIHIERHGPFTEGLPVELELHFSEVTSVYWGESGTRAWISFSVLGAGNSTGTISPAAITKNGFVISEVTTIPYHDANSIVIDTDITPNAKNHFAAIKQHYDAYRRNEQQHTNPTIIQQDSAIDKLKKLKELKELGVLNEEEYEEKRQKLLQEI